MSCSTFKLFVVEECRDLERSLKVIVFEFINIVNIGVVWNKQVNILSILKQNVSNRSFSMTIYSEWPICEPCTRVLC